MNTLLDTGIMRELMGTTADSGRTFMVDLMEMFVGDARTALERMRRHALANDAAALAREAHRLKGSSATVGAIRLAASCLAIELAARSGVCAGLEAQIERALDILDATRVGLAVFFRGTIAAA